MPLITCIPYKLSAIYTAVLMHMTGSNSSTQILDSASGYNIPNPYIPPHLQVTTEMPQSGTSSLHMEGAEALVSSSTTPFAFTGDFTFEMFFYPTVYEGGVLFGIGGISGANWQSQSLSLDGSGYLHYAAFSNSATGGSSSSTTIANDVVSTGPKYLTNQWNHLAVTRSGSSYSIYLNGTRVISITSSLAPYAPSYPTTFGNYPFNSTNNFLNTGAGFIGFLDNIRVTKGIARYTGTSCIVPTTPFGKTAGTDPYWANVSCLLDMETLDAGGVPIDSAGQASMSFVKDANQASFQVARTNPFGVSACLQLDNANSGYIVDQSAKLNLGTNDFTVECWLWSTSTNTNYKSIFATRKHIAATNTGFSLGLHDTSLYVYADQFVIPLASTPFPTSKWNHIAFVRSNGVFTLYLNGVAIGSNSSLSYNFTDAVFGIACNTDGTENWTQRSSNNTGSYLSELRVSIGARYTSNFTVPTAPFTPD